MSAERPKLREEHDDVAADDEPHEELSLKQLSEAYAQVLQEQGIPSELAAFVDNEASEFENDAEPAVESGAAAGSRPNAGQPSIDEVDAADNAACPISPQSIVEAILFVGAPSEVKLTSRKLAAVMRDVSPKEVKSSIDQLNSEYELSRSAFRIVEESGGYKMQLRDDLSEVQNHFFGRNRAAKLSQSAIDVLAIVGYNQPVSSNQVDDIRGQPSGAVLNQLLRRDLVAVIEPDKAKEKRFVTTDRFLQLFGLETLDDLPRTSIVSDLEELTDL